MSDTIASDTGRTSYVKRPSHFYKKLLKSDSGNLNEMTMTFSFLPFLQIVPT